MFKSRSLLSMAVLGLLMMALSAPADSQAASTRNSKAVYLKKAKKHHARGIASLAPSARPIGQGEQMLYSVKDTRPGFTRSGARNSHVQLAGVCRDAFGTTFYSTDKGYSTCIDARTLNTSSVNSYFGGAQRQAGVGFVVR